LHNNYAVTTKLSNHASIVPKCPKDTSAQTPRTCKNVLVPKFGRSEVSWVRSAHQPHTDAISAMRHLPASL